MKNALLGLIAGLFLFWAWTHFTKKTASETSINTTPLIQEQIKNVGKLIVSEGHFSEVITYKDAKKLYLDLLSAEKRALVVVNAEVSISFDLHKLEYTLDSIQKAITITFIPEPTVQINPNLSYYDVQQDYLNPFGADDYNKIKKQVDMSLKKKIAASNLMSNAQNRLITELQQFQIISNQLGWKVVHEAQVLNQHPILNSDDPTPTF